MFLFIIHTFFFHLLNYYIIIIINNNIIIIIFQLYIIFFFIIYFFYYYYYILLIIKLSLAIRLHVTASQSLLRCRFRCAYKQSVTQACLIVVR